MEKSVETDTGERILKILLRGLVIIPIFLILLLLLAIAIERGAVPQGREVLFARLCVFITSAAAARSSAGHIKRRRVLFGLLGTADLAALLLILGVFTKESTFVNISLLKNLAAVIFGGFLGSLLGSGTGKGRRKTKKHNKL